jgi:hypothetical protein
LLKQSLKILHFALFEFIHNYLPTGNNCPNSNSYETFYQQVHSKYYLLSKDNNGSSFDNKEELQKMAKLVSNL